MKFEYHYRHVDQSESLDSFTEERLEKVTRYLLKDGRCVVYYNMYRYEYKVEVAVYSGEGQFKATATSVESFYAAVDEAMDKLSRQFLKKRKKVQTHKNYSKSKAARYEHLNEYLEYEYGDDYYKKVG